MKRLFILRHAKSSWSDENLSDRERPLNERGLRTAPFMGSLMSKRGFLPDRIVSSPAKRTGQTAELLLQGIGNEIPLSFDERIYEAAPRTLAEVVSETGNELASVMIVGHNPGVEGLIRSLTSVYEPMPTAALAVIDLAIDSWSEIGSETGTLVAVIRPKDEMASARD